MKIILLKANPSILKMPRTIDSWEYEFLEILNKIPDGMTFDYLVEADFFFVRSEG